MFAQNFKLLRFIMSAGLVGFVGLGAVACSKPSAVNPVDAERVRKIDTTVEQIRKAYTGKDPSVFQSLFMPLESLRKMEAAIRQDFAFYDQISLDFTIDRVMVEGPDVAVYFHWQGQWKAPDEEQPLRERGHAVFRMVGHQTLTLSGVDGDAPFGMSARRIPVERPGGR
ncbi:MAG: hypothetical protein EPO02_06595 [Nitrospirae bacterium]|nr:MAG: hypothetical protein EPO02_06595 [Nitrospirota bacterium]